MGTKQTDHSSGQSSPSALQPNAGPELLDLPTFVGLIDTLDVGIVVLGTDYRCCYANAAASAIIGQSVDSLLGQYLLSTGSEEDLSEVEAHLATLLGGAPGDQVHLPWSPGGTARDIEALGRRIEVGGNLLIVISLRDITEHWRRKREATAIAEIASSLTFEQSMEATLNALAATVVHVSKAVACAVTLIDEGVDLFQLVGTSGLPEGYAAAVESSYRAGANLASIEAFRTRQPVVRSLRSYVLQDPHQAPVHHLLRDVSWDALVSVPLVFRDRALGAMSCSYPVGFTPRDDEIAFLSTIAAQAAVAVETARLFVEVHEKAALEERQRLARELHDSVSQALYGIGLGARTARTLLDRDPNRAAEPLDYVLSLAEAGMAEMRALIFELRPESLAEEGLRAALGRQTAALRARHQLVVETDLCPEPDVPFPVKEALYRVAQEALHNAVKHARAAHLGLSLQPTPTGTILEVNDDGVGFAAGNSYPGHLGLRSMRERVERLGGTLTVKSAPGRGTLIRAEVPRYTDE